MGGNKILKAVDGISLDIYKGETLGLVGKSGCGKSTFGRTLMHLYEATGGTITYDGKPINSKMSARDRFEMTWWMQMIFQDPYSSLNLRMMVMDIVAEGIDAHGLAKNKEDRKFCSRCPYAEDRCHGGIPPLVEVKPNHWVACRELSASKK